MRFYFKNGIANQVVKYKGVSGRLAILKLKIDSKVKLPISTARGEAEEREKFYGDLEKISEEEKEYYALITGDFNAKVGRSKESHRTVGKFGFGETNQRVEELIGENF